MRNFWLAFILLLVIAVQGSMAQDNHFSLWSLKDFGDCLQNDIFVEAENGFRLNPDWEIARIEYLYQWWGLAPSPSFDYQILERDGTEFRKDDAAVDTELVNNFVDSLQSLIPSHQILAGLSHTDDYPSWTLELAGTDDEIIEISSSSTANPGHAPWNVYYKGCLFAQLNGQLAEPLAALFSSEEGNPAAAFFPGGLEEGMVYFSTQGWPAQMNMGFTGLLPLVGSFFYQLDIDNTQIIGRINGRSSIAGLGNMVIGSITGLESITLSDGENTINCEIDDLESTDPVAALWNFTCPLAEQNEGSPYHYPIQVSFVTDADEHFVIDGILEGTWAISDFWNISQDAFIHDAFIANADISALLETNHLAFAFYNAALSLENINEGTITGQAILMGESSVGDAPIRYTVDTPFAIEDGVVTVWSLSEAELEDTLRRVLNQPLVAQAYEADPELIVNLSYTESAEFPEMPYLMDAVPSAYSLSISTCSQEGTVLPSEQEALVAFSLNSYWYSWKPQFVLSGDNDLAVAALDLWPLDQNLAESLMPVELSAIKLEDFERISFDYLSGYHMAEMLFVVREDLPVDEVQAYQELFESLGASVELSYDTYLLVNGLKLSVDEQGSIHLLACES